MGDRAIIEVTSVTMHDPAREQSWVMAQPAGSAARPTRWHLYGPAVAPGDTAIVRPGLGARAEEQIGDILQIEPLGAAHGRLLRYLGWGMLGVHGQRAAERASRIRRGEEKLGKALERGPDVLASLGVDVRSCQPLHEAWLRKDLGKAGRIALLCAGLEPGQADRVVVTLGTELDRTIKHDPYALARLPGMRFTFVDRLARTLGEKADGQSRIQAALEDHLRWHELRGETAVPAYKLASETAAKLGVGLPAVLRLLREMTTQGTLRTHKVHGREIVIHRVHDEREDRLAAEIAKRCSSGRLLPAHTQSLVAAALEAAIAHGKPLDEGQKAAAETMASAGCSLLIGGPGTGKTTLLQSVVSAIQLVEENHRIVLLAPTGRAAKRMTEATGLEAKTIHRALGMDPGRGGFLHHKENPIPADTIVVDEASMLDLNIADSLIAAVPKHARLILVGDPNQLPPVGAGRVLADTIESNVIPLAQLSAVHRQAAGSPIIRLANSISRGSLPPLPGPGDSMASATLWRCTSEKTLEFAVTAAVQGMKTTGLDPLRDVQVLAPANGGSAGIQALNIALQAALNPGRPNDLPGELRAGDRVVQRKNDYGKGVFNGDIGTVVEVSADGLIVSFEQDEIYYEHDEANDLALAWCLSVHKSQGSEYRGVVLVISDEPESRPLARRQLLFTAVTRAKEAIMLVGPEAAFQRAAATLDPPPNCSTLPGKMREATAKAKGSPW